MEQTLHSREVGRPNLNERHASEQLQSYTSASPNSARTAPFFTTHRYSYDDSMRADFYDMDCQEAMDAKTSQQPQSKADAPVLPQKSALRASRLLDNLVGLKALSAPLDSPSLSQTTPHDAYLSSEEEASSSAGDFSDYDFDYDSSSEGSPSPTKEQKSHEDTARIVSVVFMGKPSVIDVPLTRRSISPNSLNRRQSMLDLTANMPSAPAATRRLSVSTIATSSLVSVEARPHPPRTSSMQPQQRPPQTPFTSKKEKPFFLTIDPYAKGSKYSLEMTVEPKEIQEEERPKTPRTPTAMFKGVARTLSLLKKKSVPKLNQSLSPYGEGRTNASSSSPYRESTLLAAQSMYSLMEDEKPTEPQAIPPMPVQQPQPPSPPPVQQPQVAPPPPPIPATSPVTYEEIVRAAKKNEKSTRRLTAVRTSTLDSPDLVSSPLSTPTLKKSITGFNAARRRMSIKLTGKF